MIRKFVCTIFMAAVATAAEMEWMRDLDAAAEKAAAENKLLLVEFTGSDWCKFCTVQKNKVLDTPVFTAWVQKHCIPVEIDVPNDVYRVGGEQQKRRNTRICEEFNVKNFPSLKIMSPELVVLGGYKGAQSNPADAIASLEQSFPNAEALKNALSLTGAARTAALRKMYDAQHPDERKGNFELLRLLVESDPADTTGLAQQYKQKDQMRRLHRALDAAATDEEKLSILDKTLSEALPENLSEIKITKARLLNEKTLRLVKQSRTKEDIARIIPILEQILPCTNTPVQRAQVEHFINICKNTPEQILQIGKRL